MIEMLAPTDVSYLCIGAGVTGWLLGAGLYSFRRFVWKAFN
jgi:hypothetical protein